MERGSIYYTLVFIVSFLPKAYASHRIFSCGESVNNLKTCLPAVYLIGSLTSKAEKIGGTQLHVALIIVCRKELFQTDILYYFLNPHRTLQWIFSGIRGGYRRRDKRNIWLEQCFINLKKVRQHVGKYKSISSR